jgi:hypothetical protein
VLHAGDDIEPLEEAEAVAPVAGRAVSAQVEHQHLEPGALQIDGQADEAAIPGGALAAVAAVQHHDADVRAGNRQQPRGQRRAFVGRPQRQRLIGGTERRGRALGSDDTLGTRQRVRDHGRDSERGGAQRQQCHEP